MDHLNFRNEALVMNQLEPNEHIVFSCKVLKYNRFGIKQERYLLLTTKKIVNVKKTEFQRKIAIELFKALTKSTEKSNMEFVLHVKD